MHFTVGTVTLNSNFANLETWNCFQLDRVKNYLNPYFAKKSWRVFALFKSIFLRTRSLSNTRWFALKKRKVGKGNLYLTKIDQVETKFVVRKIIAVIWVICVKKNAQIWTLIKQLLAKYRIFMKFAQISNIHKNCNFSNITGIF